MQLVLAENNFSAGSQCSSLWAYGCLSFTTLNNKKIPLSVFMLN